MRKMTSKLTLVIGNKNHSSWSLRPWLLMKEAEIPFKEIVIPLRTVTTVSKILRYSPSGRVPVLIDGKLTIWESLAICEYIAERFPKKHLWPQNTGARAVARSMSLEMHAGFQALRQDMPMNVCARFPEKKRAGGVSDDIKRVTEIWNVCRKQYGKGGGMLFGHFSVVDAMFAPVVLRFVTYGVKVDSISRTYMDAILSLRAMKEWIEEAKGEVE